LNTFKARPKYLLPPTLVLAVSALCALALIYSYGETFFTVMPFEETGSGPYLNALYFVVAIGVAGTIVYLVSKVRLVKSLKFITALVYAVVTYTLMDIYFTAGLFLVGLYELLTFIPLTVAVYAFAVGVVLFAILGKRRNLRRGVTLVVSSGLGALLGYSIPTLSAVMILLALSAYDVFAVFKGPLGKMAKYLGDEESGLSAFIFTYGELKIGLGDLVFYSMLTSHSLIFFGVAPFLGAMAGVLIGVYIVLKMVENHRMFPGLPFALALGLALAFLIYGLQMTVT
jgi:presenilin-like A22 family membrane protease